MKITVLQNPLVKAVIILLIFCAAVFIRFYNLEADPDWRLDWSTGLFTDEAFYLQNARNEMLFNKANLDDFNNQIINPIQHQITLTVFKNFGVGLTPLRTVNGILGQLSAICIGIAIGKLSNRKAGLIAFGVLALDNSYALYNRLALMETPISFYLSVAFMLWAFGVSKNKETEDYSINPFWHFTAGLLVGFAIVSKFSAGIAIPAFILSVLFVPVQRKVKLNSIIATLAGLGIVLTLWQVFWAAPHQSELNHMLAYYRSHQIQPGSLMKLGKNILVGIFGWKMGWANFHFQQQPAQMTLAVFSIIYLIRNRKKSEMLTGLFTAIWLLCGILLMTVSSYAPSRYYVIYMPALAGLAGWFITKLYKFITEPLSRWDIVLYVSIFVFAFYHSMKCAYTNVSFIYLLYLSLFIYFIYKTIHDQKIAKIGDKLPEYKAIYHARKQKVIYLHFLAYSTFFASILSYHFTYFANPTYDMRDAQLWVKQNIPPNAVIVGDCAPVLCVTSPNRSVMVLPGLANWPQPVERFNADYIATISGNSQPWWKESYPNIINSRQKVAEFEFGNQSAVLYKVQKDKE